MAEIKTIGILTSGGDAPGMNAAIRAVVRTGRYHELRVMGIRKGYNGLLCGDIFEMDSRTVSEILHKGGTILQTARSIEFSTKDGVEKAANICKIFGIDGLAVIGGDGSFRGARDLSRVGLPTVGIPATIDNDINCSEYTIGFDTALNTIKDAIDKIRDTATSHERCSVVEVMGRGAGYLAINVGIASGAEAVIIPEEKFDFQRDVIRKIIEGKHRGKQHYIVILAEGMGEAVDIAKQIEKETGIETRATILGHLQRGGSPTVKDRVMASRLGARATELLKNNEGSRVVALKDNKVVDYEIEEALNMKKSIDKDLIELSRILAH
jgi:6-phosphofructokinase 1